MICTTSRSAWRGSTAKSNEWRNNTRSTVRAINGSCSSRAVRIETAEDLFQFVFRYTRAAILDHAPRDGLRAIIRLVDNHIDLCARGRERARIVYQIANNLAERTIAPADKQACTHRIISEMNRY